MPLISDPEIFLQHQKLAGSRVDRISRKLKDLKNIFHDQQAFSKQSGDTLVYEVESYFPVAENTEGGLFYGITYLHPGKVGNEYFMTKGHFHQIRNRGEFYWTLEGEGMLILMDEKRNTHAEKMFPGSIHYINGHIAHRTVNTGSSLLSFGAVWPSDAGHDYETIREHGFSGILVDENGIPTLKDNR